MDKSSILKLIIQYLNEKGYNEVSKIIESESKVQLESDELKKLIFYINQGDFESAIALILENCSESEIFNIVPKIRIRQIFELLLENKTQETLQFLRKIVNSGNYYDKDPMIETCTSLIFLQNKDILLSKMKELNEYCLSRESILNYIKSVLNQGNSKLKTLCPGSLVKNLDLVIKNQIKSCKFHNTQINKFSYYENHSCCKECIPTKALINIEKHNEEIQNIILSKSGNYFAVILKSHSFAVYQIIINEKEKNSRKTSYDNPSNQSNLFKSEEKLQKIDEEKSKYYVDVKMINVIQAHKNQITDLKWNGDKYIITCSKDQTIKIFNPFLQTNHMIVSLEGHNSMVNSIVYLEKENKILSIGLDNNIFIWPFERKTYEIYKKIATTVSEIMYCEKFNQIIFIEATNNTISFNDFTTKNEVFRLKINDAIVSTALSKIDKGAFLLINSSKETPVLSLLNIETREIERKFFGHRQERFNIKCDFGGQDENFLICGSEEAKIYIWNRNHSIPIYSIKAHSAPVNSVVFPYFGLMKNLIISCSDDHTIRFFSNDLIIKAVFDENKTSKNLVFSFGEKTFETPKNQQKRNNQITGMIAGEHESSEGDNSLNSDI